MSRENSTKSTGFGSGLAAVLVTVSSAVGLGNIWKFPTVIGANGGGAFLVIYLLAIAMIGVPTLIAEMLIGHQGKAGPVGSFTELAPHTKWRFIGHLGVMASLVLVAFYSDVAGWVLYYLGKALGGGVLTSETQVAMAMFQDTVANPWKAVCCQLMVLAWLGGVLWFGVSGGLERISKLFLPVLLVMLVLLAGYALTLPGAGAGLKFLLAPNFYLVNHETILVAMGFAFFKLSVGMAVMLTYASYFPPKISLFKTAGQIVTADLLVSLLAGIAIFPAVFSFGLEPQAGAGLLFVTMPVVFNGLPGGSVLIVAFFFLGLIAASGALLSMCEGGVNYLQNSWNLPRKTAVLVAMVAYALTGLLASLSMTPVLNGVKILGRNFFDLFDHVSSDFIMPIGGLAICLFVGHILSGETVKNYLQCIGDEKVWLVKSWYVLVRYITPVLILMVFLGSSGLWDAISK